MRAGRHDEGRALLVHAQQRLEGVPERSAVGVLLAEAELRSNRQADPETWLRSSASPAEATRALGELLLRFGSAREAVWPLRLHLTQCPAEQLDEARQSLAWALVWPGNPFALLEVNRLSQQVALTSVKAKLLRAEVLHALERFAESAALLEEAYAEAQASTRLGAYIGLLLAQSFIDAGKLDPARALIERWAPIYPCTASFRRAAIDARARAQSRAADAPVLLSVA